MNTQNGRSRQMLSEWQGSAVVSRLLHHLQTYKLQCFDNKKMQT